MWSQTKTLISSGANQIEENYTVNGSWGQVFTNQIDENYSFSEGFQQYETLENHTVFTDKITIQPNPTSGQVQLRSSSKIKNIKIFDGSGLLVKARSVESDFTLLDLSNLSSGIYFIHIQSEKQTSNIQKIIKL